jgi:hypothetical protein
VRLISVDSQGHSHGGHPHGARDHASHARKDTQDNDHSAESHSLSLSSPAAVELSDPSQSHAGLTHARATNVSRKTSRFPDFNMLGVLVLVHILGVALNSVAVSECKLLPRLEVESSCNSYRLRLKFEMAYVSRLRRCLSSHRVRLC